MFGCSEVTNCKTHTNIISNNNTNIDINLNANPNMTCLSETPLSSPFWSPKVLYCRHFFRPHQSERAVLSSLLGLTRAKMLYCRIF